MRAQHKCSPPQNHALRNSTATTDVSVRFLQHSSPDCIGLVIFTRPTACRSSRSGRLGGMPELPSARLSFTAVYRNCEKLAGKAPDEIPKSDLQLRPSRGRNCGLKLRSSENHPLPDGIVGKSRPLGSETSNKSRGFCSIMSFKAPLSSLIDPRQPHLARSPSILLRSVGKPTPFHGSSTTRSHPPRCSRLTSRICLSLGASIRGWERTQATSSGSSQPGWHTRTRITSSPPSSLHWIVTESHISSSPNLRMRCPIVTERLSAAARNEPTGLAEQST